MRLLLCCLALFFTVQANAQSFSLPKLDTISVPSVSVNLEQVGKVMIKMSYAGAIPRTKSIVSRLEGKQIKKIQLLYTDYPKGASLKQLNTKRLQQLFKLLPAAFSDKTISWELVKQTDCQTQRAANKLFHGFVISYVTSATEIEPSLEMKELEMVVEGTLEPNDSTILRVMRRNPEWDSMLVVADLTGSMSPYIGQLLLWMTLKSATHPAKYFVFFNDGDDKLTKDKVIGETGGIYTTAYTSMDSLIKIVAITVQNGWGGDTPENNMEATLQGIQEYPDFKELIMIADNGAVPRDLSLLKNIKQPIKIILCGTEKGINPIYLEVARRNKGSIHTIERDIENLMQVKEGQIVTIGEERFKVLKGKIVKLKE